jgi:hypothetical protein
MTTRNSKRKKTVTSSPTSPPSSDMERALLEKLSDKLDAMSAQMVIQSAQLTTQLAKSDKMEAVILELRSEMASVLSASKAKDDIINKHVDQINNCEQALRSSSLRILGLPLKRDSTPIKIIDTIFDCILQPILETAKARGEIGEYPSRRFLIDSAFTIPSKTPLSCPVIVKLSSVFIRSLIFSYKNDVLPKVPDPNSNRLRYKYGIYEDLTQANFSQFRTFAEDQRTTTIWTYNGQIKFRMRDSEAIYRVRSLHDTINSICKSKAPSNSSAIIP